MSVFTHTYRFSLSLSELFTYSLSDSSLIQSLSSVSWTRGARPRGNLLYGQTWLETPDPVRSPKLSNRCRISGSASAGEIPLLLMLFYLFREVEAGPKAPLSGLKDFGPI